MREIIKEALELLDRGQDFAIVTLASERGSTPRAAGAEMIVRGDGSIAGTIGGGLLEATMMRAAADVIAERRSRTVSFALNGTDVASEEKMVCGGAAEVLIAYVPQGDAALRDICREMAAAVEQQRRAWFFTVLPLDRSAEVERCLLRADDIIIGAAPCDARQLRVSVGKIAVHGSTTLPDGRQILVEPIELVCTAIIVGAGHVGAALAPVCKRVGFRTVIVDDRVEFANRERFAEADDIVVPSSFDDALRGIDIGEHSYIVIVTRGHMHDATVLRQALRTQATYVGLMGSRTKWGRFHEALRQEGYAEADIARVRTPIGVSIGAETPAELAISIVAEMIAVRAGHAL